MFRLGRSVVMCLALVYLVSLPGTGQASHHRNPNACCSAPVEVTWCVTDPCTGCCHTVCACLPACCDCQTPCMVSWRKGLLGRKILCYEFPCGECVEVVIPRIGKAFAR
jgi:hypothetical protein